MNIRDDRQRGEVCRALTSWISGGPWWAPLEGEHGRAIVVSRPTDLAISIATGESAHGKSTSEVAMIAFAYALWSGNTEANIDIVGPMLFTFDKKRKNMVGSLLIALADDVDPSAIEKWIWLWGSK